GTGRALAPTALERRVGCAVVVSHQLDETATVLFAYEAAWRRLTDPALDAELWPSARAAAEFCVRALDEGGLPIETADLWEGRQPPSSAHWRHREAAFSAMRTIVTPGATRGCSPRSGSACGIDRSAASTATRGRSPTPNASRRRWVCSRSRWPTTAVRSGCCRLPGVTRCSFSPPGRSSPWS